MGASDDEDAYLYGSDDEQTKVEVALEVAHEVSGSDSEDSEDDIDIIIGDTPLNEDKKDESKEELKEVKEESKDGVLIDVNAVAEHEGKPITSIDLASFKDKPWRAPGADISDYFNYGFDEFSWTAYTSKQDTLRGDYNPQKLMNELIAAKRMPPNSQVLSNTPMPMMSFPGMPGMGMPGMPMPPPGFPMPPPGMNMKNMQMPPNFKR